MEVSGQLDPPATLPQQRDCSEVGIRNFGLTASYVLTGPRTLE